MPTGKHYDLDTDSTLVNNSDTTIASQKAIKTYVDTEVDKKADPTIIRDTNSDISVKELVINRLTNEEYDVAIKEDDQLYLTPDTTDQDIANAISAHNTSNSAHSTLFNAKQDKLTTQTAYTSKGTASKVPQITTNTLGQVTNITEVDITHQSIKTLKTDNTSAQTTSSSEAIAGSGTINLHKVSKTGSYNDLLNKPSINNNTITIQKNSTTVDSFTLNQSTDKSINISVPTTVAELSDASDYVQTSSLEEAATVAKTGDYNDLINKPTIPQGTVTSVRVQATSPVVSSQNTAQTGTLNTTISLADAYGDTKNPYGSKTTNTVLAAPNGSNGAPSFRALVKADIPLVSETAASGGTTTSLVTTGEKYTWNSKQDALTTQTAYTSKGSATKVPQITTNSLGQVTGITEVTISQPTVNNKTITIQKNSTTVDSFTLNQSTDKTINITVPTKTSDITNDSGFLTSHQSIKTLKTDNTTTQTASASEAINGSGTINLHKVSKTGSYNDLLDKPTIPTTTDSVTSGSTAALTSGGAYTNLVRRKSTTAATGGANQGVYVDANGQVQACNATTSTYSSTGTTAVNGTAVASALGNYIPRNFDGSVGNTGQALAGVIYGNTARPKGYFTNFNLLHAVEDKFFGADRSYKLGDTPATITCNYSVTNMVDGNYGGHNTSINPSTAFSTTPFVWQITRTAQFEASDVCNLYLVGHRLTYAMNVTDYKIEVAYKYSGGEFTWGTLVDYSGSAVNILNKHYGVYYSNHGGSSSYHGVFGIRLTISGATSTAFDLCEVMLLCSRGTERVASALNTIDGRNGGKVTGDITIPTEYGSFIGNLTGTADKATKDGDNNIISSTYLKLAGGTMTGGLKFGTSAIPQETNPTYMLSMDAFASGGAVKWVSIANIKAGKDGDGNTISSTYVKTANLPTKLSDFTDDLGSSPVHTHSQYQPSGNYISYTNNTATVAGTSKTVSKTNPETLYVPDGLIMGGTAQAAGLVTRGICGVASPSATGAATKDNLFINYDGDNTYRSGRQLVLQAGNVGTHYGNNLYQYAAARGDAVKNYADATYAAKATSLSGYGITDAYTKTEVDGMISSVYKPAGSVAFASLPALSDNVLGNVYNVTDAFTTTANFVEGAGKSYPAGTNVVVVNTGTTASPTYKFDVLAGFVDLSGYVPTSRKVNGKALSADITISKSDVGLENVDNTSDSDKPISTATQTALDGKENTISDLSKIRSGANSFYVKGTQTASTPSFTGVLSAVDELYEGLTIDYWLPFAGTSTAATLNLTLAGGTTTGAINCYYAGTTRLTTHLAATCVGRFIYQTVTISGTNYTGWWLLRAYYYDSNTNTHNLSQDQNYRAYAGMALPKYCLLMKGLNGRLYPMVNDYSTATNKVVTTVGLRPDKIWMYDGNATCNAGAVIADKKLYRDFSSTAGNSYFNGTMPTYCDIYLCGDYDENTNLFYLATTDASGNASTTDFYRFVPYNTEPTYSDYFITGRYYIFLGSSYSSANYFQLMDQHELYYYDGQNLINANDKPKYSATFVDWSD